MRFYIMSEFCVGICTLQKSFFKHNQNVTYDSNMVEVSLRGHLPTYERICSPVDGLADIC